MTREEKIAILKDIIDEEIIHPQVRRDVGIWAIKALEQQPVLDRDCEHCSKTYGTLGCCDTVSNEWVYSCKEGQREYLLDKIKGYVDHIRNTGMGKKKSLEFIEKFIEGLKAEPCEDIDFRLWEKDDMKEMKKTHVIYVYAESYEDAKRLFYALYRPSVDKKSLCDEEAWENGECLQIETMFEVWRICKREDGET